MKKTIDTAALIKEAAILTGGVAIIAAAVYFFLVPSHASVSSISGLGIVLANFVPLPLSAITMILNVVLLIIGFFTCGREFGAKTVYTSILLPVFIGLFERLFPDIGSLTDSQELDVLCYILVVSVGLSILFNRNASSGGLDIVAKIMNKYLHIELGRAMSLSGMCVALSAALGSLAAWGNFAGMALTVQKACSTGSEDASRQLLRLSRTWRMLALALFVIAAIKLPVFHWVAALIPLLFPRLTILGMHALGLYKPKEKGGE